MRRAVFFKKINQSYLVVWLVFLLSFCYLGFLAFSIHDGIYYAGDQGIKSLEVKQITEGYGFKYLHTPQPEWVKDIWKAGFCPLRVPFFYPSPKGFLIVFPPAFQILSAFFYSRLGPPGLYIIPMLSTLGLLCWFVVLLKRCGIKPAMTASALFILVFCTPLALYGVMFWEHLPAVFLLFAGLAFIVSPPEKTWAAAALGAVSGLAVFLRPEALMMNFLYALAIGILFIRERRPAQLAFLASLSVTVLLFFSFNYFEYGSIMGVHGRQVFEDNNPNTRMGLHHGFVNLWDNNRISTRYFGFTLLLLPLLYHWIKIRRTADPRPALLSGIVIVFSLVTPFLLPNDGVVQWGARYFLVIIPVTLMALFLVENQWNLIEGRRVPVWLLILIIAGTGYSFYRNTHGGGYKELRWRYNQRLSASYALMNEKPGNVVILSRHWLINDVAYLFEKNYFFVASGDDSLRRLLPLLKRNGIHQFIYVYNPQIPTLPKMLKDSTNSFLWAPPDKKPWIKEDYAAKTYTIL
jgi:hypothetical protein